MEEPSRAKLHRVFAKVLDMNAAEEVILKSVTQAIDMLSAVSFNNIPSVVIGVDPVVTVTWIRNFDGVSLYFNGNDTFGYATKYGNDLFRYKERKIKQKLPMEIIKLIRDLSKEIHHPSYVVGWNGTLMELAENIGNMRFNRQADFFGFMSAEILRQAEKGHTRQRLSSRLHAIADILNDLKENYDAAAEISKPFMVENVA